MAETGAANKTRSGKKSFFKKVKEEFKKIIWTDKKTLAKQTLAVIVISIIMCVIISLVDGVALQLMQLVMQ